MGGEDKGDEMKGKGGEKRTGRGEEGDERKMGESGGR